LGRLTRLRRAAALAAGTVAVAAVQAAAASAATPSWRLIAPPASLGPGPTYHAVPYPGELGWMPSGASPVLSTYGASGAIAAWSGPKGEVITSASGNGTWGRIFTVGAVASEQTPEIVTATDPNGAALVGWATQIGSPYPSANWQVASAYLGAESYVWGSSALLGEASAPNLQVQGPALAFDPRGDAYSAWRQPDGPALLSASMPAGTGKWGTPQVVSASFTPLARPQLAVDPAGDAAAVWDAVTPNGVRLAAAVDPRGHGWLAPVALGAQPTELAVAALPGRRVAALWVTGGGEGRGSLLYIQGDLATGRWGPVTTLRSGVGDGSSIGLSVSEQGAILAWWDAPPFGAGHEVLQARTKGPRGRWSRPTTVASWWRGPEGQGSPKSPRACFGSSQPVIAFDARGDVLAAWGEECGSAFVARRSAHGRRWSTPVEITHMLASSWSRVFSRWSPAFAIEPSGTILVAGLIPGAAEGPYQERVPSTVSIAALRYGR
jgi:hypothetical protein